MENTVKLQQPLPKADFANKTSEEIIAVRREIAATHMREMGTFFWRAEEDVVYTLLNGILPEESDRVHKLAIRAGRLYQGVPYSFAGSTGAAFLDYAGEPDAQGVLPVGGIHWKLLSGTGKMSARVGNDCSSAVMQAWSQIGNSYRFTSTQFMVRDRGYLPVGNYVSPPNENVSNRQTCRENGEQTMFEAYACLRLADGLVCREKGAGHALMAESVDVVRNADGTIDGDASVIHYMEQSRAHLLEEEKYFHPERQEDVYITFGLDMKQTFREAFAEGYLPITCRELLDPAPAEIPTVWDSVAAPAADTLLEGVISSNWPIDRVDMTITDANGKTVQYGAVYSIRDPRRYALEVQQIAEETPERMRGRIAPEELPAGSYRCVLNCRLTTGQVFTVRDFAFDR